MRQEIMAMTDGERVVHSANLLEISEYEVFRRAHQQWYGVEADLHDLEQHFGRYLYFTATPPWVRHYTRNVLEDGPLPNVVPLHSSRLAGVFSRFTESRLGRFLTQ